MLTAELSAMTIMTSQVPLSSRSAAVNKPTQINYPPHTPNQCKADQFAARSEIQYIKSPTARGKAYSSAGRKPVRTQNILPPIFQFFPTSTTSRANTSCVTDKTTTTRTPAQPQDVISPGWRVGRNCKASHRVRCCACPHHRVERVPEPVNPRRPTCCPPSEVA
ncbi:hypothetical protein K461DRAFT_181726 [Myriangium duriaei CBS 260.36]|uniref:Uncharacterized protein n=1 Tax=Myriangium duriaei CBS 260.36 TaxID=1168546 RepID=A0A9P4J1N2_9PEZI|nr:hypothetical protein K461DRAFT_181726 [Myriangium duriaei CBS 260.36]